MIDIQAIIVDNTSRYRVRTNLLRNTATQAAGARRRMSCCMGFCKKRKRFKVRKVIVVATCLVIVGGLCCVDCLGGKKEPSQHSDGAIDVVDMTGNEATPEACMLAIKSEVESLDSRGEYKIAYRLINDCLVHNYSLENVRYAIEHAKSHLSKLLPYNTTSQKSVFLNPEDETNKKLLSDVLKNEGMARVAECLIPESGIIRLVLHWNSLSDADKENLQFATEQQFSLVDKDASNAIMAQYDTLRDSLQAYLDLLLKSYPTGEPDDVKQHYFSIRDRAEVLKKQVKEARCNYVSYQVISPALAEIAKEHYLATFKWLGFDDKQKIRDSVIHLAHLFHHEWIFASTEEVRLQYSEVIRSLKNDVGKAEWEELKAVTTLVDSNDPSKPRGADAWWK